MIKAAAFAALLVALPTAADAQGAFTTDEAAHCGVVFARMADALVATENAPDVLVRQVAVGLPIWEYELISTAPDDEERLNAAVKTAIDRLMADMPEGDGAAAARGDFLLAQAQACGRMIDAAYPDAAHPVVENLRTADISTKAVPIPSPKPDPNAPKRRKRGLR